MYQPVIDTVGIEIEAAPLSKQAAKKILREIYPNAKVVGDGSIRTHGKGTFGLKDITFNSTLKDIVGRSICQSRQEYGIELVTPIISTEDPFWYKKISNCLINLELLGDVLNLSTGIHIHVNAKGLPIEILQNVLTLWEALEAGIYRLSCGPLGEFRGVNHKDAHYCRPLTGNGPLVTKDHLGNYRQSFTLKTLKNAKTVQELATAFGRSDTYSGVHYHPPRYVGLNFHSLYRLGSLEFRTFNCTHTPAHLLAWVALTQNILRKAMDKHIPEELPKHPYGSSNMSLDYLVGLLEFQDAQVVYTLEELWNMGKFPPPLKGLRLTHTRGEIDWKGVSGKLLPPKKQIDEIYPADSFPGKKTSNPLSGGISLKILKEIIGR